MPQTHRGTRPLVQDCSVLFQASARQSAALQPVIAGPRVSGAGAWSGLNLCWLCIEFPLLCFIYAFHHHAESIFLLHSPHAMPSVPFLSLCSEVNGSFDKNREGGGGEDTPFYFQQAKFQTIFLAGFWMARGKRHFDGTLCWAISALCRDFPKHVLGEASNLPEKCVIFWQRKE